MQPQDPKREQAAFEPQPQPQEPFVRPVVQPAPSPVLEENVYQEQEQEQEKQPVARGDVIDWYASEYIQHEKSSMWYIILAAITVVIAALLIIFVKDWVFAVLIIVIGITMAVYARRPPREIHYVIDLQGVRVGETLHHYEEFRSFGVVSEEAFFSIQLIPFKRFRPAVILFFAEQDGERIVDALGAHIPMQPVKHDIIEQFFRFIRF